MFKKLLAIALLLSAQTQCFYINKIINNTNESIYIAQSMKKMEIAPGAQIDCIFDVPEQSSSSDWYHRLYMEFKRVTKDAHSAAKNPHPFIDISEGLHRFLNVYSSLKNKHRGEFVSLEIDQNLKYGDALTIVITQHHKFYWQPLTNRQFMFGIVQPSGKPAFSVEIMKSECNA